MSDQPGENLSLRPGMPVFFRRFMSVPVRFITHVLMLPVDVLFLFFDLFSVNLRKTRLFKTDCRGPFRATMGGACLPSQKYTNRWLFRLICNDVVREPGASGYLCDADVGTKIYWVRGAAVLLFFAGVGILAAWAVVVYRPRITMDARSDAAARALMKERMQKADDAFQAGDYSKALSFLQGALRRDPGNEEFLYKTGLCFERLAKPAKAQEYFYLAAKEDKAYPPALLKMAGYMYSKGILGRAGRYAQRAVEAKVADGPTLAILADWCIWTGRMEAATLHLASAVKESPKNDVVQLAQAHFHLLKGGLDEAEKALGGVGEHTAANPLFEVYSADLIGRRGRIEDALDKMEKTVRKYPGLFWLSLRVIEIDLMLGRGNNAIERLKNLENNYELPPELKLQLARVLSMYGRDGKAIQLAKECLKQDDSSVAGNVLLGEVYLKRGLTDLATEHVMAALDLDPNDVNSLLLAGKVAMAQGQPAQAVVYFESVVQADSGNAAGYYFLSSAHIRLDDWKSAEKYLKKACELAPESGGFHYEYGLALLASKKRAEAEKEFLRTIELLPKHYEAYTRLAVIAQKNGKTKDARKYYTKALESSPDKAVVAANNMACMLIAKNENLSLAVFLAYSAYTNSRGTRLESGTADTLAMALIKAGQPARAVSVARVAAAAEPGSQERLVRLGVAEDAAGNFKEADAAFKKAIALSPDSPEGKLARRLLTELQKQKPVRLEKD